MGESYLNGGRLRFACASAFLRAFSFLFRLRSLAFAFVFLRALAFARVCLLAFLLAKKFGSFCFAFVFSAVFFAAAFRRFSRGEALFFLGFSFFLFLFFLVSSLWVLGVGLPLLGFPSYRSPLLSLAFWRWGFPFPAWLRFFVATCLVGRFCFFAF